MKNSRQEAYRKILLRSTRSKITCQISLKIFDTGLLAEHTSLKTFVTVYCNKSYYMEFEDKVHDNFVTAFDDDKIAGTKKVFFH